MGSISAMSSIERVLEQHGDEIRREWTQEVPAALIPPFRRVVLSNDIYGIQVEWEFEDGITLPGPRIDIDSLADRFPDCDVGY